MEPQQKEEIILKGIPASPGVAHGPALVFLQKALDIPSYDVSEDKRAHEIERFEQALVETRRQISGIRSEISDKIGEEEALIFDAHLLVLEDKALIDDTIREVEDTGLNIEYCLQQVCSRYIEAFQNIDDSYIKERVTDIKDVSHRLLNNLMGHTHFRIGNISDKAIIVSEDLTPSDTASIDNDKVLGLVTDTGSRTSHAVIMARSIEVPVVVGLHEATAKVKTGDDLLVDGYDGIVIINPSQDSLFRYGRLKMERQSIQRVFDTEIHKPSKTLDDKKVTLMANIEGFEDPEVLKKCGAEGVGLFRTEAIFLRGDKFPEEEEQFEAYRKIIEIFKPQPVIIRTLDLGGDKTLGSGLLEYMEDNPFMGFRAIRFCLENPVVFKTQLRAILRASAYGNAKIMYPMISSHKELIEANQLLEEAKDELRTGGLAFDENLNVGSMIEVPSAAYTIDLLADHCKFFSIGTNDLIQYLLAVDRVNDRIAHLYEPNHPAVMRTIKSIVDAAHSKGIPVGVCGEIAGDPLYAVLLFGMGVNELSVTPIALPEIKFMVRNLNMSDAEKLAETVLGMDDPISIYDHLREFYTHYVGAEIRKHL